jgi:hypothetical protein
MLWTLVSLLIHTIVVPGATVTEAGSKFSCWLLPMPLGMVMSTVPVDGVEVVVVVTVVVVLLLVVDVVVVVVVLLVGVLDVVVVVVVVDVLLVLGTKMK